MVLVKSISPARREAKQDGSEASSPAWGRTRNRSDLTSVHFNYWIWTESNTHTHTHREREIETLVVVIWWQTPAAEREASRRSVRIVASLVQSACHNTIPHGRAMNQHQPAGKNKWAGLTEWESGREGGLMLATTKRPWIVVRSAPLTTVPYTPTCFAVRRR